MIIEIQWYFWYLKIFIKGFDYLSRKLDAATSHGMGIDQLHLCGIPIGSISLIPKTDWRTSQLPDTMTVETKKKFCGWNNEFSCTQL